MIKALVLDFGGVCFPTDWQGISKEMEKKFNMNTLVRSNGDPKANVIYDDIQIGKKQMRDLFVYLNKEGHNVEEIMDTFRELFTKYRTRNGDIFRLIKELKGKLHVYGLTDTNEISFETQKALGHLGDFKDVYTSFQLGSTKKERATFSKLLEKIGALPEDVLFVDDNEQNIGNARSIGMNALYYENAEQLKKELNKFGVKIK